MRRHIFIYIVSTFALLPSTYAQSMCADIFVSEYNVNVDPAYLADMATWQKAFNANTMNALLGRKAPKIPSELGFSISDFQTSREFRSWFEFESRLAKDVTEKSNPVPAKAKLLADPRDAFAAKLIAIRQAKFSIDMAYYIVRGDESSLGILGELKEALRRGVNIRLLYDGTGSLGIVTSNPMRALIEFSKNSSGFTLGLDGKPTKVKAKLELVQFHPASSAPIALLRTTLTKFANIFRRALNQPELDPLRFSMNRRSHDKILLIDGAFEDRSIAFIGGRNLGNDYYGTPDASNGTFVDMEVMIKGLGRADIRSGVASGTQMQQYFDRLYFHTGNALVTRTLLGFITGYRKTLAEMDVQRRNFSQNLKLDGDEAELRKSLLDDGVEQHKIEIVDTFHNLYRNKADRKSEIIDRKMEMKNSRALMSAIEKRIINENQEIVIVSPYLWMSQRQIRLIKSWLLKDPNRKLTIVTASIMTSDNMLAQILVDSVVGPELMLDKGLFDKSGNQFRRSVSPQVQIFELGKLDGTELGGTEIYEKLHMKAALMKGSNVSIVGTFNNDPRSLLLNSEGAAIIEGEKIATELNSTIQDLIKKSHLWGSEEYHAIRTHEKLSATKRLVAEHLALFYELIMRLKLWWLI